MKGRGNQMAGDVERKERAKRERGGKERRANAGVREGERRDEQGGRGK